VAEPWLRLAGVGATTAATVAAPLVVGAAVLSAWELAVRLGGVPPYILPGPILIAETLIQDWASLLPSLVNTLRTTILAFALAALGGLALAVLFAQSRWAELSFFPYAVILQVTPIVAIAPLIIIWVRDTELALLACAWIVAFFPVVANTTLGLNSTDHNLLNLYELYGASRRQVLWQLRLPSALPYYLAGLRISGGLALIGAVVAEFVAGTGGAASGLAYRILESGYRLNVPRMFAALLLISLAGIAIFLALTWLQHLALRGWHESAVRREN
jgi:NitT/TauT family transport system permease protein